MHRPGKAVQAAALALCLVAGASCADHQRVSRDDALRSLIEAERAFARTAAELGIRDAFVAFLAEDAILFRPRAVNGQAWLRDQPSTPGLLSWEPVVADVSAAGDLGLTFGPWTFRPGPGEDVVARGHYFSVWQRQPDGAWKVVIDHGTAEAPAPDTSAAVTPLSAGYAGQPSGAVDRAAARAALLQADRRFADEARSRGLRAASTQYVAADVQVLRNGRAVQVGSDALWEPAAGRPIPITWAVLGGDVSRSGDLGYTYGEYEPIGAAASDSAGQGNYVRAWRRENDGRWRVVVDLMMSLPSS